MSYETSGGYLRECRAMFRIAWPLLIAQLAQMGTGVVDTVMAGHYSAMDLAAIAIGYNIWLPLYLLLVGLTLGATTIIAQDFGAGRLQKIRDNLPQSLWLSLAAGMLVLPACYFSGPILGLLQLDAPTYTKSQDYLQAVAWGMPAAALFQSLRSHTQGIGILKPFAIASVIGFVANIPLNYAFIYGRLGAPEMGAAGCGWATAISMWLGPLLIAFYMARARALKPYLPPLRPVAPNGTVIGEIARLGLPIGLTFFLEVAVFSIIGLMIATMGNRAMAAHQIAFNVWDVVYMPLIAFGSAMTTRVGHAIGAGDRRGVSLAIRTGGAFNLGVAVLCMTLLLSAPEPIIRAYTDDEGIRALAIALIRLAALFILLDALQVSASFALRAFKDTRYPFLVMCLAYWLLTLPLGYWLGLVQAQSAADGTTGFWRAMIVGILVSAVLILWRLRRVLARPLPPPEAAQEQPF